MLKKIRFHSFIHSWSFDSAARGYHFYRKYWTPYLSQRLDCYHEPNNAFDQFAIKMVMMEKNREKIVGHLPREISRPTKFLLVKGAVIHAEISSVKYRHSLLVQGVLELSCKVFVPMPSTVLNENLISKYKSLVAPLYVEPTKEAEVGSFEREKHQTDFSIKSTKTGVQAKLKRKSQQSAPEEPETYVRFLFSRVPRQVRETERKKPENL